MGGEEEGICSLPELPFTVSEKVPERLSMQGSGTRDLKMDGAGEELREVK